MESFSADVSLDAPQAAAGEGRAAEKLPEARFVQREPRRLVHGERIEEGIERRVAVERCAEVVGTAALAGVGFKIKFKDVFSKGLKPIALGGITWLCVAIASYAFGFLFAGYIG